MSERILVSQRCLSATWVFTLVCKSCPGFSAILEPGDDFVTDHFVVLTDEMGAQVNNEHPA